ncbi:MAG TPA: SPFH domain-containing protein [Chloroflexota bacterium]|nr:SPFH domain-containing protein [Chloroflexota bacterium]
MSVDLPSRYNLSSLPELRRSGLRNWALMGAAAVGALLVVGLFTSSSTVQAGHVGVVTTFGSVEPVVLQPGFHFVLPFAQRIVQIDTRVSPHTFKEIDAASQELQTVKLTGTMNYHLDAARAYELYQNVGLEFAANIIDPAFSDFIKEVVPQYKVTDILIKRDEIRTLARQKLGDNLSRYGIIVDDIYISDIAFSTDYQAAIEKKQTAQQAVETERQILDQKKVQADQAVAEADGKARAAVQAAQGEADANRARTASITPELIDYLRWTKWDGRLPMFQGGQQPLISVPLDTATGGGSNSPAAQPTVPVAPQVQPTAPAPAQQTAPRPASTPLPRPTAAP